MIATARAAKVIAAMDFRTSVLPEDIQIAIRLGLVWRATKLPQSQDVEPEFQTQDDLESEPDSAPENLDAKQAPPPPTEPQNNDEQQAPEPLNLDPDQLQAMQDTILEAALSTLAPEVLSAMVAAAAPRQSKATAGSSGAKIRYANHGKKRGAYRTKPNAATRLDILQTLRAAAPWQRIRAANVPLDGRQGKASQAKVHIRKQDFRYPRIDQCARSTMIFIVDASGSSALNRLAEAKGAIEILLGQCYVRRDQVCMVSFRGTTAEISLPVTRSLARAKRSLNGLPGGGGTPIALGLDLAVGVAKQCQQRGETPFLILLTDGKANVSRAGTGGRSVAHNEALAAAHAIGSQDIRALVLDTSTQSNPLAQEIANTMRAKYIALPYAGATKMAAAVSQVTFGQNALSQNGSPR